MWWARWRDPALGVVACCWHWLTLRAAVTAAPRLVCITEPMPVEKVTHSWHFGWRGAVQPGTARGHAHNRSSRAISVYEGDKFAKMEGSHQNKSLSLSHES